MPGPAREQTRQYIFSARRSWRRYGVHPSRLLTHEDDRPVFVLGSPRSGTTFTATSLGKVPGFADLGELRPLKRTVGELVTAPVSDAARRIRRTVTISQRVGLTAGLRAVEQTPESSFLIPAIRAAFPRARFVHLVRDGRDVAASLLGLGWLRMDARAMTDEVGQPLGDSARFWVEPERADDFATVTEATRAAWVWRRYESTARAMLDQAGPAGYELRYERLVAHPMDVAEELSHFLDATDRSPQFADAFRQTRGTAAGRWRKDLTDEQLSDVMGEAGALLDQLGYET